MDSDWKAKVDKKIEKDREKKKKKQDQVEKEAKDKERREYDTNLRKLQRKFSCHVCGKSATRPGEATIDVGDYKPRETVDDWILPGDLSKCTICHKWTCKEHIHKDICQKCGNKLDKPWWLRWLI